MKRSLFIAIVVLLMAALFVSCNADKAVEDQLFEVTIDGGARGLSATGTVNVDIDDLYWYYTATKTSGLFRTGEKTVLTPVKTNTNNEPVKGLTSASLGPMSKGGWNFCFYGYAEADPTTDAVFFQENLAATVSAATVLQVTLERGNAVLDASVVFNGITWKIPAADAALVGTLTLEVSCTEMETVEYGATPWDATTGIATFSGTYALSGAGDKTLTFSVFNTYTTENGTTLKEKVGEEPITLKVINGIQYTVVNTSDGNGISLYEDEAPQTVEIGTITVPQSEIKGFTAESTGAAVVNAAGAKVTFPASALTTADHTLSVSTTPRATAEEDFQIEGSTAVAAIDVKLDNEASSEFTGLVEIETTIETGLDNVSVQYKNGTTYSSTFMYDPDGEGEQQAVETPYLKSYTASTGKLVIQTNHFSEYVAVIDSVAKIGDKAYGSLAAAVAAAPNDGTEITIKLLKDVCGTGIGLFNNKNATNKNIVIDLCNHTYTLSGGAVGSTGTESQAWHLEKGNTVTIKNGTLTSTATSGVLMLVQNYCNLTLENVTLDGRNIPGSGRYVLSNNCGNVNLTGNTSIIAKAGDFAFDVCGYASYAGVTVTVDTTGTINGNVETSRSSNNTNEVKLVIKNGVFTKAIKAYTGNVIIEGGDFSVGSDCAIYILNDCNLTFSGGTVTAPEMCVLVLDGAKLTVDGGEFNSTDNAVIGTNGSTGRGGNVITINGGTFNGGITTAGYVACGIYLANADTLTINDGTFVITGGAGIVARAGQTVINGGSFECTGTATGKVGDSRVVVPCNAIVFDEEAAYPGLTDESRITVNGGSFTTAYDDYYSTVPADPSIDRIIITM